MVNSSNDLSWSLSTRIETQILEPLEAKLREVYELDEIVSFASQGFSTTVLEIKDEVTPA